MSGHVCFPSFSFFAPPLPPVTDYMLSIAHGTNVRSRETSFGPLKTHLDRCKCYAECDDEDYDEDKWRREFEGCGWERERGVSCLLP
jgi:hypothetical protein